MVTRRMRKEELQNESKKYFYVCSISYVFIMPG